MADYIQNIKKALWHSKACEKSIRKAFAWIGADPDADEPAQEGLAPRPPDDDIEYPDIIEPNPPIYDDPDNPQRGVMYLIYDQLKRTNR
jgi:hypothetical protein